MARVSVAVVAVGAGRYPMLALQATDFPTGTVMGGIGVAVLPPEIPQTIIAVYATGIAMVVPAGDIDGAVVQGIAVVWIAVIGIAVIPVTDPADAIAVVTIGVGRIVPGVQCPERLVQPGIVYRYRIASHRIGWPVFLHIAFTITIGGTSTQNQYKRQQHQLFHGGSPARMTASVYSSCLNRI